jgi:type I restriction enzyme R subunit
MQPVSANFGFLKRHREPLFTLAALAEHYFRTDPNTCLYKLRQFGELMAKDIAARAGLLNDREQSQAMVIGAIGRGRYWTTRLSKSAALRSCP